MLIVKVFVYFLALKVGAQFLFDESLAIIASAICAVIMVGVEAFAGNIFIAPQLGGHLVRARFGGAGVVSGLIKTLPGLAICAAINSALTMLIIFAFSRDLWSEFTNWRGLEWEAVFLWATLIFAISLVNHLLLIWAATHHAKTVS